MDEGERELGPLGGIRHHLGELRFHVFQFARELL